ncbi:BCCT family transporter [Romboutsia sp. 1001216sp1]|uniref:BCCT family transporter n=1 Tax=unclassified Romboutsia TaxID=2626894 RepID=UPI0018A9F350|nr:MULTISPECIES: BCCT family transporter [unclassified Romboutsia]MDB8792804.1 BCCT family transporter [Romboutsia sp. 1001216sp1]MDB8795394.1 BCCT family transporter [Romboutsia sp. 1001216sp1]MDB8799204.1 BCCT family transporter [Romboutsia sp. 1001216sp1]
MNNIYNKNKTNYVFLLSLILSISVVFSGIAFPDKFKEISNNMFNVIIKNFSWVYIITMLILVGFAIFLVCSKYGDIKLGKDNDKPEFSKLSWFSMLFGAGMGIGLIFFGTIEPMKHFIAPIGATPASDEAVTFAMQQSYIHWGLHPWAAYSIMGLALAYFQFRKDSPGLISSIFLPILGEDGVRGPIGKTIDILAVFTTVTGIATSLGMGTMQIAGGLEYVFNIENTLKLQIIIIAIATVLYILSSTSGLDKGIKILSNVNLSLAVFILVGAIIIGPKLEMIDNFRSGTQAYLTEFISQSIYMDPSKEWIGQWRVFYWALWIAWIPFVGVFIARISKGRTIREFIVGVTLAPALVCMVWFTVFGTLGIHLGPAFVKGATKVTELALFEVFSQYQLGGMLSIVAMVLLCTFFVSSADSATYVLGMFTSNGDLNPKGSKKIAWGLIQALLAIALLLSGGLDTLQMVSIVSAFPFTIIVLLSIVSIIKALREEVKQENIYVVSKKSSLYKDRKSAKYNIEKINN